MYDTNNEKARSLVAALARFAKVLKEKRWIIRHR